VATWLETNGGRIVIDPGSVHPLNDYEVTLNPGEYWLHFQSLGPQHVQVQWTLKPLSLDYEKTQYNGIPQSAALSTSLVDLPASGSDPASTSQAPISSPVATPSAPSSGSPMANGSPVAATPAGAGANSNAITVTAAPIPAGLLVSLNTGVMGLPSATAQHVAAVGPTAEGGSIALADAAAGLLPGIRYHSVPGPEDRPGTGDPPVGPDATVLAPVVASDAGLPAPDGTDPGSGRVRADVQALARADWLVRLAARVADAIAPASSEEPVVLATMATPAAVPTHPNQPASPPSDSAGSASVDPWQSVVHADLGAPLSLVAALAFSHRLRRPLRKWWRRQDQIIATAQTLPRFPGRGPYTGLPRPMPSRRSRKVCVPS
jgi:hypothetical protein